MVSENFLPDSGDLVVIQNDFSPEGHKKGRYGIVVGPSDDYDMHPEALFWLVLLNKRLLSVHISHMKVLVRGDIN